MINLDTEHISFWMDAVRNCNNRDRILESFWKGQLRSKVWLIERLESFLSESVSIDIFGGWNGVLASLLFQSEINISKIRSIDIDPSCEDAANTINKLEEIAGRFLAVTEDMCESKSFADIVINTSCEHISQNQYHKWLSNVTNQNSLIIVQSNNYEIPEHIRISNSLQEFESQSNLHILWSGELELPMYKRFMVIGRKKC